MGGRSSRHARVLRPRLAGAALRHAPHARAVGPGVPMLSGAMSSVRAALVEHARRLAGHRRVLPLTALLLRARTVRPAGAFVLREAVRRRGLFAYTLRENGLRVAIRHGTGDVVTLGEVFHEHDYEPPAALTHRLGGARRIVDLGANIGLFGAFAAARWPGAQIVGYEPD